MKRAGKEYKKTHWGNAGTSPTRRLRAADPHDGIFVELGTLESVVYSTAKGTGPIEHWEHEFSNPKPTLAYDPETGLLLIGGGRYTVTTRGIER